MENLDATNFASNCTKVGTTFEKTPTIYISSTNEGKTKVRWGAIVGQKMRKYVNVNNIMFKRSPCHVLNLNKMTMKSSCIKSMREISWGQTCIKSSNIWENSSKLSIYDLHF
jgi:hypothetical protein